MAHNLHVDETGKVAMFCVGKQTDAWHHLGQRCDTAASAEEAMKLAGLDWLVGKQQNYARNLNNEVVPTESYTIFRSSDNQQLGTVGAGYAVRQNWQHFEFVDALLEANGGSHYDSAGALGNGSRIWLSVRIPAADFAVGDDKHELYLTFATSHDGTMSHTVMIVDVRVVCQNTLNMALNAAKGERMFKVRHTKNAHSRLDEATNLMTGVKQNAETLQEKFNLLARRKMTKQSFVTILNRLFPEPKGENANTTRRENVLNDVLSLYEANDNNAFPEQKGTAYALLNAVTNYTDHMRTARITSAREGMDVSTARAENAVMGSGQILKNQALEVILQETADGQTIQTYKPSDMDDVVNGLLRNVTI